MFTSQQLANTIALVVLALAGCAASGSIDRPPPVLSHYRIVATSDGFAIERIEADGSTDAPTPLVPLGRTIRLDPALLGSPSPSLFRSTLHAPSLQDGQPGPIGNKRDPALEPDERGIASSGKSATADDRQ